MKKRIYDKLVVATIAYSFVGVCIGLAAMIAALRKNDQ